MPEYDYFYHNGVRYTIAQPINRQVIPRPDPNVTYTFEEWCYYYRHIGEDLLRIMPQIELNQLLDHYSTYRNVREEWQGRPSETILAESLRAMQEAIWPAILNDPQPAEPFSFEEWCRRHRGLTDAEFASLPYESVRGLLYEYHGYRGTFSIYGTNKALSNNVNVCHDCKYRHAEGLKVCGQAQSVEERRRDGHCPHKEVGEPAQLELEVKPYEEFLVNHRIEQAPKNLRQLEEHEELSLFKLRSTPRQLKHYEYQRRFERQLGKVQIRQSLIYDGAVNTNLLFERIAGHLKDLSSFELLLHEAEPFRPNTGCYWVVYRIVYRIAPGQEFQHKRRRSAGKRQLQVTK